jgi:hypothetical protein
LKDWGRGYDLDATKINSLYFEEFEGISHFSVLRMGDLHDCGILSFVCHFISPSDHQGGLGIGRADLKFEEGYDTAGGAETADSLTGTHNLEYGDFTSLFL